MMKKKMQNEWRVAVEAVDVGMRDETEEKGESKWQRHQHQHKKKQQQKQQM